MLLGATTLAGAKTFITVSSQKVEDKAPVAADVTAKDGVFTFGPVTYPITNKPAQKVLVSVTVLSKDFIPLHGSAKVTVF